jgi:very-short-patch-repair endonuclease
MPRKIIVLDVEDIIKRYLSKESAFCISQSLKESYCKFGPRPEITQMLQHLGIWRDRSEREKFANKCNPQMRYLKTKKAHDTVRGSKRSIETLTHHSKALEGRINKNSLGEKQFYDVMIRSGFNIIPQKSVDVYNLDFAFHQFPIGMEIFSGYFHDMRDPILIKRFKHLFNLGWNIVIVKTDSKHVITDSIANYFHSLLELFSKNPTIRSHYQVIGCDGQILSPYRINFNDRAIIEGLGNPLQFPIPINS